MKSLFFICIIAALSIVLVGCCSMCKQQQGSTGKCPACSMMHKMTCPHCGMAKQQCKCGGKVPMAEINTSALKALTDSGTKLTLIDARTGKFDDGRRIANAIALSPEAKENEIQATLPNKEALIVSYCANLKCPASRQLAARLTALGYKHVLEYPQGIEGWLSEGYPVSSAKP